MRLYIIASEGWRAEDQIKDNDLPTTVNICVTADQLRGIFNCTLFVCSSYEDLLDAPRIRRIIDHYRQEPDVDVVDLD